MPEITFIKRPNNPTTTFKRETYLAKTSQVGAPNGNQGLFFKKYNNHSKVRAKLMDISDNPDKKLKKPKPFRNLTKQAFKSDDVELNEFDAKNPDRRGFKTGKEFRGDRPLKFKPSVRFNPDIAGGSAAKRSGWFQGGFSQELVSESAHNEKQYHMHESGAWLGDQNRNPSKKDAISKGKKSINPFPIKIKPTLKIKYSMN
jgi:hypothetical protein